MTLVFKLIVWGGETGNRRLSHYDFAVNINEDALLGGEKAHNSCDKKANSMNKLMQV